jgi:hypothetical protein
MNVWMFCIGSRELLKIFIQRATGNVGEGRRQGFSLNSVMAFGTQINLQVS